ncbi:toxin-antitoxin system HicB family antitoxin [Ornithinimicrobium panacihumi]|uniref:toxin-antitoxin system HicB family antitoxin n=1 Tax=Ornithinimicrobium panacihumi TaxID=2008449 RepID=UPI003F8ABCA3
MNLQPYLAAVGEDLSRATALADDHTREVAARVATAVEPALRLALVQALSDAAAQITTQLDGAVVTLRMDGRDPELVVQDLPGTTDGTTDGTSGTQDEQDDDIARVTVRIPEPLKKRAESLAAGADQSLNTWIVAAIRRATTTDRPGTTSSPRSHSRRITGWA